MGSKREIHALDYAVCDLMAALDRLFFKKVEGWELNRNGFNIGVEAGEYSRERLVRTFPINWPSPSTVVCRFERFGRYGWTAYKGVVYAEHIGFRFTFKGGFNPNCGTTIEV